ncbi:hypothetical protein DPMN_071333 [Dreissena polymorpha]|uniref:Uncharacterized protein n=1 Tax=Dreissena polymorpha TaxID=45954 RepID=A0A9D4BPJ7_DREPO|nr:hypothetical protein DPMN_071333 [Dreissena polymorpha]
MSNHGLPFVTIADHGHHCQPWLTMVTIADHGPCFFVTMANHVSEHVSPRFLMADNQIPWSTIKNHDDHGLPWSSFCLGQREKLE